MLYILSSCVNVYYDAPSSNINGLEVLHCIPSPLFKKNSEQVSSELSTNLSLGAAMCQFTLIFLKQMQRYSREK